MSDDRNDNADVGQNVIELQPSRDTRKQRKSERRAEYMSQRYEARRDLTPIAPFKPGPPRKYSAEIGQQVLDALLQHGSLIGACRQEKSLPDVRTVYRWLSVEPEFASAYARTRVLLAERMLDEVLQIADDETLDPLARRVRTEARRWIMSVTAPQRYGSKVSIGGDMAAMLIGGASISLADLSNEELDALEALCQARLARISAAEPAGNIEVSAVDGDHGGDD